MRIVQTTVYLYDELSDEAKENARNWYKEGEVFHWSDEWLESIEAFCNHFGVTLENWSVRPFTPINYSTDAENKHFRNVKLRSIDRDVMPTGFCGDNDLWFAFHDEFKRTGDAKAAFDYALYEGFKSWRTDWETAYEDEQVDDAIIANDYEFNEQGERV